MQNQQGERPGLTLEQIELWIAEKERLGWKREDFARRLAEILGIRPKEGGDE